MRAAPDELCHRVVEPGIRLVLPIADVDKTSLVRHARLKTRGFEEIPFVLGCLVVVKDPFGAYSHVFLVPDEGRGQTVKIHDRLYGDRFARYLLLDTPFIPHVGVANAVEPRACKDVADDLKRRDFAVDGAIGGLDVAWYETDRVEAIERIELGRERSDLR